MFSVIINYKKNYNFFPFQEVSQMFQHLFSNEHYLYYEFLPVGLLLSLFNYLQS